MEWFERIDIMGKLVIIIMLTYFVITTLDVIDVIIDRAKKLYYYLKNKLKK